MPVLKKNDPQEVEQALRKAEQYYLENNMNPAMPVIAFVLHGPEVEIFFGKTIGGTSLLLIWRRVYRRYVSSISKSVVRACAISMPGKKACFPLLAACRLAPRKLNV